MAASIAWWQQASTERARKMRSYYAYDAAGVEEVERRVASGQLDRAALGRLQRMRAHDLQTDEETFAINMVIDTDRVIEAIGGHAQRILTFSAKMGRLFGGGQEASLARLAYHRSLDALVATPPKRSGWGRLAGRGSRRQDGQQHIMPLTSDTLGRLHEALEGLPEGGLARSIVVRALLPDIRSAALIGAFGTLHPGTAWGDIVDPKGVAEQMPKVLGALEEYFDPVKIGLGDAESEGWGRTLSLGIIARAAINEDRHTQLSAF
jgi:hypothetical protein